MSSDANRLVGVAIDELCTRLASVLDDPPVRPLAEVQRIIEGVAARAETYLDLDEVVQTKEQVWRAVGLLTHVAVKLAVAEDRMYAEQNLD